MLGHPTRRGARRVVAIRHFLGRSRIILVLLLLAALAGSGWGGLWAYRKFKVARSGALAEMAVSYLQEGKPAEARMAVETALRLQPSNAAALRMLARLQAAAGEGAAALETWGKLAGSGGMTLEDLTVYAKSAAAAGESALAERLADAAARGGNSALRHLLRAELKGRKNDPEAVEIELRAAVEVDTTGNAKVMLAKFLLQRPLSEGTATELRGVLRELSERRDVAGAEALAGGLVRGVVPPGEMPEWIAALRSHPAVNSNLLLLADAAELQSTPGGKEGIVDSVVARMEGKPLEERFAGMQWLTRFGEPGRGAALIGRDEALQRREVLMAWMDAQSQSKNWPAVLDVLSQENVPLPGHFLKLYRGRTLKALGRVEEGDREFQEAYGMTISKPDEFREVLAYLILAREDALFERGLAEALKDKDAAAATFRALVPPIAARQDAARLLSAYEIAKGASPELAAELTLQNDMDYLSLVLGRPVDAAAVALRSEGNPRDFALRSTQGLSLLLAGKPQDDLAYLDACEPDVHVASLPPHQKLVVALALAANGRQQEANGVMALVPPFSISRQEVGLLQRYFPQPAAEPAATQKKADK